MMTVAEMYEKVRDICLSRESDFSYFGLRFEDKERNVGEIIPERSRHNPDREDERDFPEFGTAEYDELDELDGVSAWHVNLDVDTIHPGMSSREYRDCANDDCERMFSAYHCYVIAGNREGRHDDPDVGEIVIKDAVVIGKIF